MYDLIIIGGGPAGLSAGLYASRSGLNSFLIEKMGVGGQAVLTEKIENYPGFPSGIGGFELLNLMEDQAKKAGLKIKLDNVLSIKRLQDNSFIINCENENYNTRSVIIATGAVPRKLDIKGESEFT